MIIKKHIFIVTMGSSTLKLSSVIALKRIIDKKFTYKSSQFQLDLKESTLLSILKKDNPKKKKKLMMMKIYTIFTK